MKLRKGGAGMNVVNPCIIVGVLGMKVYPWSHLLFQEPLQLVMIKRAVAVWSEESGFSSKNESSLLSWELLGHEVILQHAKTY